MTATAAQTSILAGEPTRDLRGQPGHLLQLDGLRALAISLVLAQHLLPLHRPIQAWFPELAGLRPGQVIPPLGFVGVALFFVLSGFLITRILLACRDRLDARETTLGRELGVFYVRRTLRIFPLYYGTLLVLFLLDVRHVHDRISWHLAYLGNWLFSFPEHYNRGGFERHFWTLGVEEQFYLIWPWLILLIPRKLILPALVLTFAMGPVWRAWFVMRGWPWQFSQFPTPANLDLLAGGAILAYLWNTPVRRWLVWACFIIGLPAAVFSVGLYRSDWLAVERSIWQQTALALCFASFVGFAAQGVPFAGRLLEWRLITYIGKISYAMYVFHNFVPPMLRWMFHIQGYSRYPWVFGFGCVLITIAMSAASWHLFEGPINRLKNRVPYARR